MVTDSLAELVRSALKAVAEAGDLAPGSLPEPQFERPRKREHGDWATNVALIAAKGRGNPRDVAAKLVAALPESPLVERVEVAGPGFLNFHLSGSWLHEVVRRAALGDGTFGRSREGAGRRVNVEYVSANPTGPVNVVSGRHAAVGDVISNLLEATGYVVTREFYVNDAGRQIDLFARSVDARYQQALGREAELPEEGYRGDYVLDLAKEIAGEVGDSLLDLDQPERLRRLRSLGLERMLTAMRFSLAGFGTRFDVWTLESSIHAAGRVKAAISKLKSKDLIEERDGAVWFLSSRLGDDRDRVVIRSNGETTYLAADLGYLMDKFERGFDHLIYIWGADHHGTIPRLLAAAEALDYDRSAVEVPLVQIVNLSSGAESLKGSKRAGVVVALDDLVADVGADAARYTFLTRSLESHVEFDIELVRKEAPENPVYYVQYAHARICSILRKASAEGHEADASSAPLERLHHPAEEDLMRKLASYEETIPEAARFRSPQRITRYVEELAATFSAFYRDCRVVSEDRELTAARLALCVATRAVLADGLGLLGVGAPERM